MSFEPTDEQWAKMQRHIKSDAYKKEDFFVFETLAVGDKIVPNRYMKLMPELLETMKEDAIKGVSLMLNHNWSQLGVQSIPIGKVFDARIDGASQVGETTTLYTTQYILRDDSKVDGYSKNDIIKLIETGILADTSVGWGTTTESYKCNICGNSIYDWRKCEHIPGKKYIVNEETDEVKECIIEAHSPTEKHAGNNVLMENSVVFDGAYPNAIIQSSVDGTENKNGMYKALEGKQELSNDTVIIGYSSNGSINLLYKEMQKKGGSELMSKVNKLENEEVEVEEAVVVEEAEEVEEVETIEETNVEETVENNEETEVTEEATQETTEETTQETEELNEENTEALFTEKDILEKFENISEDVETLVKLAKEGFEHRENVIKNAIESGVHAMGNAFNKEVFKKTFANLNTNDIEEMGNTWENEAKSKFSSTKVSKQNFVEEPQKYEKEINFKNYRTQGNIN